MQGKLFEKIKNLFRNKKVIGVLVILLVLFLIFGRRKTVNKFAVQEVKKGKIEVAVSASGSVRSESEVKVQFQSSGKLTWLGVKEGDLVRKWQALASLDKESLKKSFERYMNLYLTNRWDFEQKQDDYKTIRENKLLDDEMKRILDKHQFSLNNAVLDLEIADLAVKYATIYSPIAGVVTSVNPPVSGLNILSTAAYVEVADPRKMEFEAIVDETDIGPLKVGQVTKVNLDAFPVKEYEGKIKRIAFKAITTTSGGTGFSVFISLPEEEMENFRIGLNGDFKAITDSKENILLVPLDALSESGDQKFVFRFLKGKAVRTTVETGLANEDFIEVTSGLDEGDIVLTENVNLLTDGQKVSVK